MAAQLILLQATELNLVARPISGYSPQLLREEFNFPEELEMVMKIEGKQTVGTRMPQGGTLSDDDIQLIKNWINKGAKNN